MHTRIIFVIIIFSYILAVTVYFLKFHDTLSNESEDWAAFGNYTSGVLMPILTIINIWVFIKLTQSINDGDAKRKVQELEYQKKLLLMQLRQKELDVFSDIINQALVLNPQPNPLNVLTPIIIASSYIESFLNNKQDVFSILKNEEFQGKIERLHLLLTGYYSYMGDFLGINSSEPSSSFDTKNCSQKILELMNLRNEIIPELQKFILDDVHL